MPTHPTAAHDELPLAARFNPLIRPYLVVVGALVLLITVVGAPLAILWLLGVGQWWARHYFDRLECVLDERSVRFSKGILFQVEKTIPLENITDVTFIEGPLLRRFDLATLRFETAGSSHGAQANMTLTGIIDARGFRERILETREALVRSRAGRRANVDADARLPTHVAAEAAALRAIDEKLADILALLKERLPPR